MCDEFKRFENEQFAVNNSFMMNIAISCRVCVCTLGTHLCISIIIFHASHSADAKIVYGWLVSMER